MKKTIMIIGAGILQVPAIEIAKEMGLRTIVTDYNPDAIGLKLADIPVVISTRDFEGTVRIAKELHKKSRIDGVFTVGTDASMTVAAVANALGLPGIKFESAEAATNKIKMRRRLKENNVPCPSFYPCWKLSDAKKAISILKFPLVIKPADNMGARGVIKISNIKELSSAFNQAKIASPSGEIIIEEYMNGPELSIDALIYNGKITITGIADRMIGFEPYFVEIGHIMPSNLPKSQQNDAVDVMIKGIKALGIDLGAAKGDIKITDKGAMVGEIAARLSGGFMSAYTYPLSTGVNIIKSAIKIALGEKPGNLKPKFQKVAVEKAIIPQPGYVVAIKNIDEAKKIPGIKEIFIRINPGDTVKVPTSNIEKAGNVIGVANNRETALKIVDKAIKTIKIDIGLVPQISLSEIRLKAQERFKGSCYACINCDGKECAGKIPGMGGIGTGASFKANLTALSNYKINLRTIHNVSNPDLGCKLFGYNFKMPIFAAPITGTKTNMNGALEEEEYAKFVVEGCSQVGSIAYVGDGAEPDAYLIGLKAISRARGCGIPIFKPRVQQNEIIKRIKKAEEFGAIAVGCDIDAAAFLTMRLKNQPVGPKSLKELKELVHCTKLPFIVKGIMTVEDGLLALESGAQAIIVSNHGGRVLDSMPGAMDVLPEIVDVLKGKIIILIDGGIRTGVDVLKCLAAGADGVLVGRPIAIGAVGGGVEGVKFILNKMASELKEAMLLTGCAKISDISNKVIRKIS